MGRGKVELKRIDNKISRQVTFSKRRSGLIKKAREISVLCEAHVALIVISSKGKLFEYSSDSSMETILERYERYSSAQSQFFPSSADQTQGSKSEEYPKLVNRIEVLQKNLRNTLGEDLDPLSSRELQNLEQQIDVGLKRIRTRKNQVMNETISNLQKKTKALQEQNNLMAKKLKESLNLFDESTNLEHQADIACPISTTLLLKLPPPGPSLIPSPSSSGDPKAGEVVEEDNERRAQTVPNSNRIPPWMLNHLTNQS